MSKEKNRAKQEKGAQARAEHQRAKRRKALITRGAGAVVLLLAVGSVGYCMRNEQQMMQAVTTTSYPAGLHEIGTITYKENPPMGGAHNAVWQNCGVYAVPIHNEHAVHALEHGAVWITYRPDLPAGDVQKLKNVAADDYMLLSPYPGLPGAVVASAWNRQLVLQSADEAQLRQFVARFKNNPSITPEFGAPCTGGTVATGEVNSLGAAPTGTGMTR